MSAPNAPTPPTAPPRSILVTGDVVHDVAVYQGDRVFPAQEGKVEPWWDTRAGGARELFDLLAAGAPGAVVWGLTDEMEPADLPAVHTLWVPCDGRTRKEREDASKQDKPPKVWRVGQALGYTLGNQPFKLSRSPAAGQPHAVLVIDDPGLSFRTHSARESWPIGVRPPEVHPAEPQPDWIILKMASPLAQGELWRALTGGTAGGRRDNLVIVVSADELRRAGAAISRGFSWERTLSELCAELNRNPAFQPLLACPRLLVVNFGCVGSVWFDNTGAPGAELPAVQNRATLVYDPTLPEGDFKTLLADERPVYGHLNTFTAALALAALENPPGSPGGTQEGARRFGWFENAIQSAMTACRLLRLVGHGPIGAERPRPPFPEIMALLRPRPTEVEQAKTERSRLVPRGYQVIPGRGSTLRPDEAETWSLAALAENPPDQPHLPLYGLAHRVALQGESALQHIPHAHFGDLLSVDRLEMETLRSLSQLIRRYEAQKSAKQPLSIAAFGPPGAGKSFGIKEIARQILTKDVPLLEFNLSQFESPEDLFGAFHQVRDKALQGLTPVVFWDEFDSADYKWLQYLLAPMQDGTFQEAGHTHAIGKCIFVFAGGTSRDFAHFGPAPMPECWQETYYPAKTTPPASETANSSGSAPPAESAPSADAAGCASTPDCDCRRLIEYYLADPTRADRDRAAHADFRRKKGPDFLSRLSGHINVLGPNPSLRYDWSTRTWHRPDPSDIAFPVRRALLLRQFLGATKPDDRLDIDRDLLRAFLHVPGYRHGARSLEKIARHAALSHPPFRRAHLPPPQVLAQHLERKEDFEAIYLRYRNFLTEDNLPQLAAAIDENYARHADRQEARTAKKEKRTHLPRPPLDQKAFFQAFESKRRSFSPWDQWLAATNLAAARRMPDILALVGLRLVKGPASAEEQRRIQKHLEHHIKRLAAEEHDLWTRFHLANGWRQADARLLKKLKRLKATNRAAHAAKIKRLKVNERIHTLLVPFDELPADQKSKDHEAIRNYPSTVGLVGWKIEFVQAEVPAPASPAVPQVPG